MIRINLLSVEKPIAATASAVRKFSFNLGEKAGPIAALFVLVGCGGYIALDYLAPAAAGRAAAPGAGRRARREGAPRSRSSREVERFEARKKELQQRVTLIEELRQNQVGAGPHARPDQPQHAGPAVAADMKQTGDDVQLDGQHQHAHRRWPTSSPTSRPRATSRSRSRSLSSEEEKANDNDLIKFSVKATFEMPGAKKPAAAGAGRRRGAAPGAVADAADFASKGPEQCSSDSTSFPGTARC